MTGRRVSEVMTAHVHAVPQRARFKDMVRLIQENRISALPVIDNDGIVIGVVSESDLLLKPAVGDAPAGRFDSARRRGERAKAAGQTAAELMTAPAITTSPQAGIPEVARIMHEQGLKRLPVVDRSGRLLGIVTRGDLLKVFLRDDEEIRREILYDVVLHGLWMDPGPLRISVEEGVVTLAGEVEKHSDAPLLETMVSHVDGVVAVRNLLRYRYEDAKVRK